MMKHELEIAGPAPWAFEFAIEESSFDPSNGYGVSVMVVDPAGDAWFMSQPSQVFGADGADAAVEIGLDPADPRAVTGE
jgi:hypothetical protein